MEKRIQKKGAASPDGSRIHEEVGLKKIEEVPTTREELYRQLTISPESRLRRNLDWVDEQLLLDNARFCIQKQLKYRLHPNVLMISDLPLKYDVLNRLFEGRRPVSDAHLSYSANGLMDLMHFTVEDKRQLVEALQSESAGEFRINDKEREILELRFGLRKEEDEDHPHTITEIRRGHKIDTRKEEVKRIEGKALLASRLPQFRHLRAYQLVEDYIASSFQLDVPAYFLAGGLLREPVTAPSELVNEARGRLLDGHWDEIPAGTRAVGREKLMELSLSDIIRGVLKKEGAGESDLLAEVYEGVGIEDPKSSTHLTKGNPEVVLANLDWCRRHGAIGKISKSALLIRDLPVRHAVLTPVFGGQINYSNLEKSVTFHLGQAGVKSDDLKELLDCMESGRFPDGSEVSPKYHINSEEKELLEGRLVATGRGRISLAGVSSEARHAAVRYLRWLENKAMLFAYSDGANTLAAHQKLKEYSAKKIRTPQISDDDAEEIIWITRRLLSKEDREASGIKPTLASARKTGWHPVLCEKRRAIRRAYELRKAVDAGWFDEKGQAAEGFGKQVESLELTKVEREMIAYYFKVTSKVDDIPRIRDELDSADPSKRSGLEERLEQLKMLRRISRPLKPFERNLLDFRCRLSSEGDQWSRGTELPRKLGVSESYVSVAEPSVLKKIRPFIPKGTAFLDGTIEEYISPAKIPAPVLERHGLELGLEFDEWSREAEEKWRSKQRKIVYDEVVGPRSLMDVPEVELLQCRIDRKTKQTSRQVGRKVAGRHGFYKRYTWSEKGTTVSMEEIPREDFLNIVEERIGMDKVDDKVLVANRFRKVHHPQGTFIEDIPYPEFIDKLVKTFDGVANIPPTVLAEHGLNMVVRYKGHVDPSRQFNQSRFIAEREIRPIEPYAVDMDEVDVSLLAPEEPMERRKRTGIRVPRARRIEEEEEEAPEAEIEAPPEPAPPAAEVEKEAAPPEPAPPPTEPRVEPAPPEPAPPPAEPEVKPAPPPAKPKPSPTPPPSKPKVEPPPPEPTPPPAKPVEKPPPPKPTPVLIPRLSLRPIDSDKSFDRVMHIFQNRLSDFRDVMDTLGIPSSEVFDALRKLPKARTGGSEFDVFENDIRERGWAVPVYAIFARTQSLESMENVYNHFEESLKDWKGRKVGMRDLPRIACYATLAHHTGVSANLSTTGDDTGNRYLRVGREYQKFVDDLQKEKLHGGTRDQFVHICRMYRNIMSAVDPEIAQKLEKVRPIQPKPTVAVARLTPQQRRELRRVGREQAEKVREAVEPPAPAVKPTPPVEEPPKEKPPEIEIKSFSDFDEMLRKFRAPYRDRMAMMRDAKIHLSVTRAVRDILTASEDVREEGEKILTFIPFIRKRGTPETMGAILKHFEESFDQFETELIKSMETGETPQNLPRLALYCVLTNQVGTGEGISIKDDALGKRYKKIGDKYQGLTSGIPEEISEQYAEIEDKYLKLVRDMYPG